jgi:hypothetical protein
MEQGYLCLYSDWGTGWTTVVLFPAIARTSGSRGSSLWWLNHRLDDRSSIPGKDFFCLRHCVGDRLWDLPSLLSNGCQGLFAPAWKWPRYEANNSLPSSAKVTEMWSCTSTLLYVFMAQGQLCLDHTTMPQWRQRSVFFNDVCMLPLPPLVGDCE